MRQSELYAKTRKAAPKDEVSKNAVLLMRAGFIHKEMAGAYTYLPLGLRVMKRIENIIRGEMNAIGGEEILLTSLQDPALWKKNDRWDDKKVDIWFKDREANLGFAWSHEEPMIRMMENHVSSYRDLPVYVYQFQTKFRNEPRAKSGLLRGREFLMKDLYSFNADEKGLDVFYERAKGAYENIFGRVGIGNITYLTHASAGVFVGSKNQEFQALSPSGEDTIYLDRKKKIAVNKGALDEKILKELKLKKEDLTEERAIEVGNIFKFGTAYTDKLGLTYKDEKGKEQSVYLGSYGIGLGRLMATVVEVLADKKGLVWPESVAPFKAHLVELEKGLGKKLYGELHKRGISVLYDDRDASAGEKFNDADLIGIPWRLVVSEKTKGKVEIKKRTEENANIISYGDALRKLS